VIAVFVATLDSRRLRRAQAVADDARSRLHEPIDRWVATNSLEDFPYVIDGKTGRLVRDVTDFGRVLFRSRRAPETARKYLSAAAEWGAFVQALHEQSSVAFVADPTPKYADGPSLLRFDVDEDHLRAFRDWRLEPALESGMKPVSQRTWNLELRNGIDGFYDWAVDHGHLTERPFAYEFRRRRGRRGRNWDDGAVRVNLLMVCESAEKPPVWLTREQFQVVIDVGIRGLSPNGGRRSYLRWRLRDETSARFLVSAGLRRAELCGLCLFDFVENPAPAGVHRIWLPDAICKNRRGRAAYLSQQLVNRLRIYLSSAARGDLGHG